MDFLKILGKNAWEYVKCIPFFLLIGLYFIISFVILALLILGIPIAIFNLFINVGIISETNPSFNAFLIFTVWISLVFAVIISMTELQDVKKPVLSKLIEGLIMTLNILVVVNVPIALLINLIPISPLSKLSVDNQFLIGLIIYFLFMGMVYLLSKLIKDTKKEYDRRDY